MSSRTSILAMVGFENVGRMRRKTRQKHKKSGQIVFEVKVVFSKKCNGSKHCEPRTPLFPKKNVVQLSVDNE